MDLTKCGCEIEPGAWIYAECEHGLQWVYRNGGLVPWEKMTRPVIVCLCGSTRFSEAFQDANLKETLSGKIVLTIGCDTKGDDELFDQEFMTPDELANIKARLDILHLRKIDLADEVLILNVGDYIGESTRRELVYARAMGKKVRFLEGDTSRE